VSTSEHDNERAADPESADEQQSAAPHPAPRAPIDVPPGPPLSETEPAAADERPDASSGDGAAPRAADVDGRQLLPSHLGVSLSTTRLGRWITANKAISAVLAVVVIASICGVVDAVIPSHDAPRAAGAMSGEDDSDSGAAPNTGADSTASAPLQSGDPSATSGGTAAANPTSLSDIFGSDSPAYFGGRVYVAGLGDASGNSAGQASFSSTDQGGQITVWSPGVGTQTLKNAWSGLNLASGDSIGSVSVADVGPQSGMDLVLAFSITHAAVGLTPPSLDLVAESFDLATGQPLQTTKLANYPNSTDTNSFEIAGSTTAPVAAMSLLDGVEIGWNAQTGATAWKTTVSDQVFNIPDDAAVEYQVASAGNDGDTCDKYVGLNPATGGAIWTVDTSQNTSGSDCSDAGDVEIVDDTADGYGPDTQVVQYDNGDGSSTVLDAATGKSLSLPDDVDIRAYDPLTHDIAYTDDDGNVQVYDMTAGKSVYSLPSAQISNLGLSIAALYGGILYTETNNARPVVKVSDGSTVTNDYEGPKPVRTINGVTIYDDGEINSNSTLVGTWTSSDSPTPAQGGE
jgi:hypothetical protein